MSDFANGYQPEDYNKAIEKGDYELSIKDYGVGTSQSSGYPMITLFLSIKEANFEFRHYITKNEYFNANMTKFFDCFHIPRGNFDFAKWIGKKGRGHIDKGEVKQDGKSYFEIKYLIVDGETPREEKHPPLESTGKSVYQKAKPADDFADDEPVF